jgi:hypothetical protein
MRRHHRLIFTWTDIAKLSTQTRFLPRGLIGCSGKILGSRALVLLHDEQGHPRLATTHRGDLHLTTGIPAVLNCYEQATQARHPTDLVVDREAMAADFLVFPFKRRVGLFGSPSWRNQQGGQSVLVAALHQLAHAVSTLVAHLLRRLGRGAFRLARPGSLSLV